MNKVNDLILETENNEVIVNDDLNEENLQKLITFIKENEKYKDL